MPAFRDPDRLVEKLETLAGERPRARRLAAVRIEDLAPLIPAPPALTAQPAAGSTPTAAEFAALLADVERMRA